MHVDLWKKIPIEGLDEVTLIELRHFIERKLDEQAKIKGQIARDLRRIGEWAFLEPTNYDKLKAKYRQRHWASRKKLAILENMRKENCKCTDQF